MMLQQVNTTIGKVPPAFMTPLVVNSFPWSLLPRQQSNILSSSFLPTLMMLQQVNTTIGKVPPWKTCLHDPSGSKRLPMEFTAKTITAKTTINLLLSCTQSK
jgi:hypothetical protein